MTQWDAPRPGTHPPGAKPEKQLRARPLRTMSVVACIGLGIAGIGALLTAGSVGERAELVDDADFEIVDIEAVIEEEEFFDDAVAADEEVSDDAAIYLVGLLVAAVPWMIWQRRFVRNAQPLGGLTRDIGWGTWGWIVPFANMYFPQAQLAEAARATDPMRARKPGSGAASPFVYLWWAVYTGSSLLTFGATLTQPDIIDVLTGTAKLSDFQRADQVAQMGYVGMGLAAGLAIATVLACTARQRHLFHAIGVRA